MSKIPMICHCTCKSVLNTLKLVLVETGQTSEQLGTVVQATSNSEICFKTAISTKITQLQKKRLYNSYEHVLELEV